MSCHRFPALLAAAALLGFGPAALSSPPGEVAQDVRFLDRGGTLSWSLAAGATGYDVYQGSDPRAGDAACVLFDVPGPTAAMAGRPGASALLYYLVTAQNADGEGPLGAASDGSPRRVAGRCDIDGDTIPAWDDVCPEVPDPGQEDQDGDGEGDRCDPQTYDFEADAPGLSPAAVTPLGGAGAGLAVRDAGGDLVAAHDGTESGLSARLDRVLADMPHQDTTVYIDFEDVPEAASVELWSDGAHAWNAGTGLILQVDAAGDIAFVERLGRTLTSTAGPPLPASGRLRARLRREAGGAAALHVDGWDGAAWSNDLAIFRLADDARHVGLATSIPDALGGARGIRRITVNHDMPTAPLTVLKDPSWSDDWKVFQRDAADLATIPVRFAWRLDVPGRVEAQVVDSVTRLPLTGHGFADHVVAVSASPGGAAGALDVAGVPAGGNYDVEIVLRNEATGEIAGGGFIGEVAVGDVFVAGGQSNMSGWSGSLAGAEPPDDAVHLFGNDYTWKRAVEPMDSPSNQVDRVSSDIFAVHSPMLSFGKAVAARTGVPVGIIPGPLGNTALYTSWQRDASDPAGRGRLYGSLLHRALLQGGATPPRGFLWFQGESDAIAGRTTAQYAADLAALLAAVRADLGAPQLVAVVAQVATNETAPLPEWVGVQEAQRQVTNADPLAILVTTVDQPLRDGNHFTVDGYKEVGRRLARAGLFLAFGAEPDPVPDLVAVRARPGGAEIDLVHERDVTSGDPALFQVEDAAGTPVVTAARSLGDTVTLTLDRAIVPPATLSYGWSRDPLSAWIEDAAGTPAPCFAGIPVEP